MSFGMDQWWVASMVLGGAGLLVSSMPRTVSAANIFVEGDGVVTAEAENFSARNNTGSPRNWTIIPTEGTQSGVYTGTLSGGQALQILPDTGGGATGTVPDVTPAVDFVFRITTTGTYRLHLKGGGFNGNSDSIYAQVVELKDGAGGTINDYYAMGLAGSANYDAWSNKGAIENGTASTAAFVDYPIATPGDYTIRLSQREDGSLVDKVVFQLSSIAAPTGGGPVESPLVPEPGTLSVMAAGCAGLLLRRSSRRSLAGQ